MNAKLSPRRKREHVLIFLTTLILAGVVGTIMANGTFPLAVVDQATIKQHAPGRPPKAKNVTATQPGEQGTAGTGEKIVVAIVEDVKQPSSAEPETQELPAPAGRLPAAHVTPNPSSSSGSPYAEFVGPIILATAVIFALAIVSILVLVFCVLGLLRWHNRRYGPLLSIEHTGAPTAAAHQAAQSNTGSFVQEHRPQEPATKHQQDPLVQRLFEEALQLQVEIDLARKTPEPVPSPS